MREYSENFLQLVNNHRSSNPPHAMAKEYKSLPKHRHVKMTQPKENKSIFNQIDPFPKLSCVSPVKQPNNLPRTKNADLIQPKSKTVSKDKQPYKRHGNFENYTAVKTHGVAKKNKSNEVNEPLAENTDKNEEDDEDIAVPDSSVMSIQRFHVLISSLSGGDGSGYPEIEAILARQPAREEEVSQAAREYWGSCRLAEESLH